MPCDLCTSMPLNTRTSRCHERLVQIGVTLRIPRPGRAKAAWLTRHVCEICETHWRHLDDPADPAAGWSMEEAIELCA